MAVLPHSSYLGYRELAPPAPPAGRRGWTFPSMSKGATYSFPLPPPPLRLQYWHWDLLGPIPFTYKVFRGEAADDYAAAFQEIDLPYGMTRLIVCTIRDNPARLIFTYDGINELPEREFSIGFARVEAVVGFKVKNAIPGMTARYQLCFML